MLWFVLHPIMCIQFLCIYPVFLVRKADEGNTPINNSNLYASIQ